jgi:hypothetical protein
MVSPFDAKLLNLLGPANSTVFKRLTPDDNHELQVRVLAEFLKAEDTTVTLSLQHLEHLGLILWPGSEAPYLMLKSAQEFISLSQLGISLLQRCTYLESTVS